MEGLVLFAILGYMAYIRIYDWENYNKKMGVRIALGRSGVVIE